MSKMFTEISRIVNEDISSRVTQYDVIFEAITNAIHSNSTDIKCFLNFNGNLIKDGDIEIGRIKVDTIKVVDNGDGITDDNYKSFSTYRTEFKKDLGCKGVGRFVFLKVYSSAKYSSELNRSLERSYSEFPTFQLQALPSHSFHHIPPDTTVPEAKTREILDVHYHTLS